MRTFLGIGLVALLANLQLKGEESTLKVLEDLAKADPKPFVIVEASGEKTKGRGQGVVISSKGHVLSVGHVAWIDEEKSFSDEFRVSFRGTGKGLPSGAVHRHKVIFSDREDTAFFEDYYSAKLQKQGESRFLKGGDLALFKMEGEGDFPKLDFFSKDQPTLNAGDTLHLCHYSFPHQAGDPLFLMSPLEVVGIAQTSSGLQYLAKGYYRVGSSGGAILKDGRLLGIQSAAYTINAKEGGELPYGLISFELVWGGMVEGLLEDEEAR